MIGYGKINVEGYLMSSPKKQDSTWLNLDTFAKDINGDFYTWYNQDGTPNTAKITEEEESKALEEAEKAMTDAVNAIQVTYNGNVFSGSLEAQNRMVVAMAKLEGKGDIKTQNWFTVDSVKVLLTRDDIDNVLDLIEPLMEAITDV